MDNPSDIHAAFHLAVAHEIVTADAAHGEPADIYEMLAILGEEVGELSQAVLDRDYKGGTRDHMLRECVQVGAMALKTFRFIHQRLGEPRGTASVLRHWPRLHVRDATTCGQSPTTRRDKKPMG